MSNKYINIFISSFPNTIYRAKVNFISHFMFAQAMKSDPLILPNEIWHIFAARKTATEKKRWKNDEKKIYVL